VRCHVLGDYFREFNNAQLDDADVVIIPESIFHKYDVSGMIASGKKVILVIDPWDDEIMRQYIEEYDVSPIRASTSTETVLRLITSLTQREVSFADAEEETAVEAVPVKEKEPEKKAEVVEHRREKFVIKINGYATDIPQFELPVLPVNATAQCLDLTALRSELEKEKKEAFEKRVKTVLEKAELIKFAKQYYYDAIPLPFPGGQYFIYGLPAVSGRGVDRVVFDYRILMDKARKMEEEKAHRAEEIRKKKLQNLPKIEHKESTGIIAVAPFRGFERCIKVDTEGLDTNEGKIVMLIGHALHVNFLDKKVVVQVKGVKGEEEIDANFKIGNEIEDYFVNERIGGIIVKARKVQDNDLVLEFKNRKIRIPGFFSERMNFAYTYLRYREIIDTLIGDIDKEVKRHIMEYKEVKNS